VRLFLETGRPEPAMDLDAKHGSKRDRPEVAPHDSCSYPSHLAGPLHMWSNARRFIDWPCSSQNPSAVNISEDYCLEDVSLAVI
jgi:hypothetical protein